MSRLFLLSILLNLSLIAFTQTYVPVDEGSKVHFVIKNFGINTGGDLSGLKGSISFTPDNLTASSFDVSVDVKTLDTDNESRDAHLKSDDYFDAEKFPEIFISSSKIEKSNSGYKFNGTLTMHGNTKNISFPFIATQQGANYLFEGSFEIDRLDYNIGGNSAVMGNTVKISLSVLAKKS